MKCFYLSCYIYIYFQNVIAEVTDSSTIRIIEDILCKVRDWQTQYHQDDIRTKPFVTVAFAQSVDGFIAPIIARDDSNNLQQVIPTTASNFILSGSESQLLTHALRSIHDGILIGGRTLSIDNPRLTNRLWMNQNHAFDENEGMKQPRPIILDTNLHHIQQIRKYRNLINPIVCCVYNSYLSSNDTEYSDICILQCRCQPNGLLDIDDVLVKLYRYYGIRSIMVEGGAQTLSSFFSSNMINALIITIAPIFLRHGIRPINADDSKEAIKCRYPTPIVLTSDSVQHVPSFVTLGDDATLISKVNIW